MYLKYNLNEATYGSKHWKNGIQEVIEMSEKNSKGLAVGLLVVGLVAGLAGGYFLQVPEVNRLNAELSASEEARSELTNQVASLESIYRKRS